MKKISVLICLILCMATAAFSQSDCSSATIICGNTQSFNPSGIGNKLEHLACGGIEHNSQWLAFQAKANGKLNFVIRAFTLAGLPTAADFDWSLFALAGAPNTGNCDAKTQISCNFAGTSTVFGIPGTTGMATPPYSATAFNPGVDVVAGNWYMLVVDQFSNTAPLLFSVQFTGNPESPYLNSTPGIFDNRPDFTAAPANCSGLYNFTNSSVATSGIASYAWNFGDGSTGTGANPSHTFVTPGTYYVTLTVTDNNGCKSDIRKTIIYNNIPPTLNAAGIFVQQSCSDGNSGYIEITTIGANTPGVTGGTAPYTFELVSPSPMVRAPQSSNVFTGLQPGTYTIKVTDFCGKSATITAVVNQLPTNSTIGMGIQNIQSSCTGTPTGSATIFANGTVPPYTMALVNSSPVTTGVLPAIQRDPVTGTYFTTFNNLLPGSYTVECTDGCGKIRRATFTVTASTIPTVAAVNNPSCAGTPTGTLNVTATSNTGLTTSGSPGTFQYALIAPSPITRPFQSSSVFENLLPGTYTIAVRDVCGNVGINTNTIATAPAASFGTPFTTLSCPNGATGSMELQVNAVGGGTPITFELVAPSPVTRPAQTDNTFLNLPPGLYTVRMTDACGTQTTSNVTISAAVAPTFSTTVTGSCSATASGTITVTPGASTLGAYTFELISPGAAIRPPQGSNVANTNNSIFTGLNQGVYTVRMTDGCGVPVTGVVNVTGPTALAFPTGSTTIPSCAAGSTGQITVAQPTTGLGAYKYELIAPSPVTRAPQYSRVFNGLPVGSYTIRITDSCGTQVTNGTLVDINPAATPALSVTNTASCATASGTITALASANQGGGTYLFSLIAPSPVTRPNQSSPVFSGLPAGTYTVQVTDQCGATGVTTTTIANAGAFTPAAGGSVVSCNGNNYNAQIIVTNPQNYTPGGPIPPGSGGGPYTYALYNFDNTVLLAGPQSSNVFSIVVPVAGNPSHTVRVTDVCGNTSTTTLAVNPPGPIFNATISAITASCAATATGVIRVTTVAAGGFPPYTYTLLDASTNAVVMPAQSGVVFNNVPANATGYFVRTTDACGNSVTTTVALPFPAAATPTLTVATVASCTSPSTGRITVTPGTGSTMAGGTFTYAVYDAGNTVLISGPQSSPVFNNIAPGTYTVRIIDRCGSVGTASATVSSTVTAPTANGAASGTCIGGSTGTVTGSSTGGSLPITYTLVDAGTNTVITGPQSSNIFTGLPAGTYIVRVTDACGTIANSANVLLSDLTTPPTITTTSALDCSGFATLSAYGTSGSGGPYTYALCSGAGCTSFGAFGTSSIFTINTNGTYRIAVRDRCGNQSISSDVNINIPVKAVITGVNKASACGTTTIFPAYTGVTNTAYFSIDGANFGPAFGPIAPGCHTIRVADYNAGTFGCASDAFQFSVHESPALSNPLTPGNWTVGCISAQVTPGIVSGTGNAGCAPNTTGVRLVACTGCSGPADAVGTIKAEGAAFNLFGATAASFEPVVVVGGTPTCTGTQVNVNFQAAPFNCTTLGACPAITVTNPATTTGTAGTAFSQTFTSSGGTGTITYATASTLPVGLSLSSAGVLSGTPTEVGTFPIVVTATDINTCTGTGATYNLVIGCPAPAGGTATPSGQSVCTGSAITTITITPVQANTVYNWTRDNTGTVTGIAASGSGNISGTLTNTTSSPVTVTFTITPVSYGSCTGTPFTATVTVNPINTITLTSAAGTDNQSVVLGNPITNITYATTGATGATFSGLPAGVTGNWAGNIVTISGTPTANGVFNYTVTLTGGCGTVTATGTMTVAACSITLTSGAGTTAQNVCNNSPITNITYSTTGATGATFAGLPAGVNGNWAANVVTISGTPTASGTFNYTVTLTGGGCGAITATGTITVAATPTVNTVTSQVICNNASTAAVTFTGSVPGTVYNWSNSDPSIGLAASGTGDIASFTATNATNAPVTATVTVTPSSGSGSAGNALIFDGSNDQGTAAIPPVFSNISANDFTIEAWVYPTNFVFSRIVFAQPSTTNFATMSMSTGGIIYFYVVKSGTTYSVATNSGIPLNTWTHVAVRWTAATNSTNVFFNGVQQASAAGGTSSTGTSGIMSIGTRPGGAQYFSGALDEIRIWNTARTQAQIAGAMSNSLPGNTPGIEAYYKFNEGTGTTTADATPAANTVTLTGSPVWQVPSTAPVTGTCDGTPTTFTYTVNPTPTVNAVTSQEVCNGTATAAITFSGNVAGTVYNWTNNTPSIGLAASGTGNIASFNAVNTGTTPVTATITVTPSYTNAGTTCTGTSTTFTITVSPTPTVNTVSNQVVCNGAPTTAVNFTGTIPGTTYNWTNNTPSIGLAASGTGNIASFNAVNTGTSPVTATVTVTPSASATNSITFNYSGSIQNWVVPAGVTSVRIEARGAEGSYNTSSTTVPGKGAVMAGDFTVTPGSTLKILVGQQVTNTSGNGGGGGSFVTTLSNTPLIVAGGGGGSSQGADSPDKNGQVTTNGGTGAGGGGTGGTGGNGGNIGGSGFQSGAGGGLLTNGTDGWTGGSAGLAFVNGGNGGVVNAPANGGFGGGGSGSSYVVGGGGGGYSGGGSGGNSTAGVGGGGGSYNAGTNQVNTGGINTGNGVVIITYTVGPVCPGTPVTFTYTVNPTPTVNAVSNQVVCNGTPTTAVTFSGAVAGTVYNWTNNTPSIGLAASGTGNIASFNAVNTGTAPVTATITVTPTYTNAGTTCTGTPTTFTITVNPTPTVNTVTNQVVCNGASTTAVNFSGNVPGTVYNWTNNTTSIGLAGSGTGNIASFNAVNTGATAVTATITVTPSYTNGGTTCTGTPITFTITVNPTPTVNAVSNQTVCNGTPTAAVTFSGAVSGTVYNWTNNTTSIGLAASGTGNIASFNAVNTGTTAVTATITVTPSYTNGGTTCTGTPTTFTITVNPTPNVVATPSSQTICSGSAITTIVMSGAVAGTTYNWTRDNTGTATGIAASGTGDISGSLTNTTNAPVTVSFTITPQTGGGSGGTLINESFNTASGATMPAGWSSQNRSNPIGTNTAGWNQFTTTPWAPFSAPNHVGANFNATTGNNTISAWLFAPNVTLHNGDVLTFYTRTSTNPTTFPDRLEVRMSTNGASTNVGATETSVGDFTTVLLTINPSLNTTAYPATFTQFSATLSGLPAGGASGRIAFRYFVTNGGPTGANSDIISIDDVVLTSAGGPTCTGTPITATVTVNPIPTVNAVSNQVVCNGAPTTAVNFSGAVTGTVYNWTNNTPSIGLAASGTGNIASFNAINTGTAPVTATITVTPTYTNAGTTCTGTPTTFTITVNPTPTVNAVTNQVVCNGAPTAAITFSGAVAGTVYNWTNNTTSIGLAASGTGNIASFNAVNTTNAPVVATITVTPSYTNGGTTCTGTPRTFTITVNPTPTVNSVPNQVVCNGAPTAPVYFTGNLSGTICGSTGENGTIFLNAPAGAVFTGVRFASYGTPTGTCGSFAIGACHAANSASVVAGLIIGQTSVAIPANNATFGDPCGGTPKALAVELIYTFNGTTYNWTNNTPSIGLAASGSGSIASFNGINTGNAPVTATITVTPSYTNAGTTCTGTPTTFTITVNPTPTVNSVPNQVVCNGAPTTAVNFTGNVAGTVYNWTNNNTTIGLAASGTGNIASFNAINTGTAPVTATITVTPTYTNGGTTCTGTPTTFTITVNPTPTVNSVPNQVVCNGAPTTAVNFSGNVPGTVYNWTNNTTSIGLAASGTGNIASFNAINTGTAPVTATITVTPTYTNGGTTCTGTPITFTITVNPTPTVNSVPNQVVCNGAPTTAVAFTGSVPGTVYNWTNNTTSIGLAASGTGNIASFNAVNTTNAPVTATITVTPSYTNGGTTCTGTPRTFTITVNPTPTVNSVPNQVVCNGAPTTAVNFTGFVPGTVYNWTNNTTSIGLAASGTGNIASFNAVNAGTAPVTATITVTPTYTNGGTTCTGTPITFTITVNPTPTVNAVPNQVVCNGAPTTAVTFTGAVTGTVFNWTNNTTSIGLAASGTGNIASFNAINTTNAPVVATITVTPSYTNGGVTCTGTPRTFTITVNPTPTVNTVANQVVCNGAPTTAVNFTGFVPGTVYNWTNNNTSIGLAASGTGNIASFNGINTGTVPAVATITVTPTYTNGGTTCTGTPITFTITVNPTPNVNPLPANQVLCNGSPTAPVVLSGTVPFTVYNWTNSAPAIGLAASGTGDIPSFNAVNTTNAPIVATITVTPVYTNGGVTCTGTPRSFTITVNPTPTVNAVANQVLCNGSPTAAITFSGAVTGTVFTWTNNNTSIGLAASGTGNIPSFNAVNTGTAPAVATITVTPRYTNGGVTCIGTPRTFTITVNPTPTVDPVANQTLCATFATAPITFGGAVTGTVFTWTNSNTAIGLGASGTGNIPSFTATNNTAAPITATITVTPGFTNGGVTCTGTPRSFTITVNPQPTITIAAAPYTSLMFNMTTTLTATINPVIAGSTITWYRNGIAVPGATGNSIVVNVDGLGTYTARTTTPLGCTALSLPVVIKDSASDKLFVYPNPNDGRFKIRYYSSAQSFGFLRTVLIYDTKGALVYNQRLPITGPYSAMDIDIRNKPQGLYIVVVADDRGRRLVEAKVVVAR